MIVAFLLTRATVFQCISIVDSICKSFVERLPGNDTEHLSLFDLDMKGKQGL